MYKWCKPGNMVELWNIIEWCSQKQVMDIAVLTTNQTGDLPPKKWPSARTPFLWLLVPPVAWHASHCLRCNMPRLVYHSLKLWSTLVNLIKCRQNRSHFRHHDHGRHGDAGKNMEKRPPQCCPKYLPISWVASCAPSKASRNPKTLRIPSPQDLRISGWVVLNGAVGVIKKTVKNYLKTIKELPKKI